MATTYGQTEDFVNLDFLFIILMSPLVQACLERSRMNDNLVNAKKI